MMRSGVVVLLATLTGVVLAAPAAAQMFRWTDERGTSHYSEGIDSVPERFRDTAVPLGLRNKPTPPPAAETTTTERPAPGSASIRYTPGQPIVVDARINGSSVTRLLLDTGADRTLISPRALASAGVSLSRVVFQGQMAGATGTDQVRYVVVDSIEVGDARVTRLPVAAYAMPHSPGDGLLGRDFLDQFNVAIDSTRGIVTLSPK